VPTGFSRKCEITRTSSDGSQNGFWVENYDTNKTNWVGQTNKTYPYEESLSVRCGYYNSSTNVVRSISEFVFANAKVLHPNYGLPCSTTDLCGVTANGTYNEDGVCSATTTTYPACDRKNVCGQNFPGLQCPTGCTANNTFTNNTCLEDFIPSTDRINPNGSVEFTWKVNNSSSTPRCSFVDLTNTLAPRLIPGLQNLDPNLDKVRITNIQASTRFCLVCSFFDLTSGALIGDAAKHQWVRVQRIGEN
jgi:hypothetical protein